MISSAFVNGSVTFYDLPNFGGSWLWLGGYGWTNLSTYGWGNIPSSLAVWW